MSDATSIVNFVMNELNGRSGFDDWWEQIDIDIRDEINLILRKGVETQLTEKDTRIAELEGMTREHLKDLMDMIGMLREQPEPYNLPRFSKELDVAIRKISASLRCESSHVANLEAENTRMREALIELQDHHCSGMCDYGTKGDESEHMKVMNRVNSAIDREDK